MEKGFCASAVLAIAGVGLLAGSAMATSIDFEVGGASEVSLSNVFDLGLSSLDVSLVAGLDGVEFNLNTGESYTFDFLSIDLAGTGGGLFDISAVLAFDSPVIESSSAEGGGGWLTTQNFFGSFTAGSLTWSDNTPDYFEIDGNYITVDFLDLTGCAVGQSFIVQAVVTNYGSTNPGAPVPEPATMLLFGTGLVGLAGVARMKKVQKE